MAMATSKKTVEKTTVSMEAPDSVPDTSSRWTARVEDGEVTLIRGAMPREDGLRGRRQGAKVNASDGHGMCVPWESQDSGCTLHALGDPRQTMWKDQLSLSHFQFGNVILFGCCLP